MVTFAPGVPGGADRNLVPDIVNDPYLRLLQGQLSMQQRKHEVRGIPVGFTLQDNAVDAQKSHA